MECSTQDGIPDVGLVDGPADQTLVQDLGPHVEHPFAEPGAGGGSPVVHHVRRQDRDSTAGGAAVSVLQVIADRALVDDEHVPGVVGVRRIRVLDEARVEDLMDARHRRLPRADPFAGQDRHAKIVQDLPSRPVLDAVDGARVDGGPIVNELVALVSFAFVGSVTPGPNNAVLWASGLRIGFSRTVPHILGTSIGIGTVVLGVAGGIGVLLTTVPGAELALKIVGSAYLLYLSFRIAGGRTVTRATIARPLSLWQALAFQYANPKAWIFAIAAVGTFLPPDLPRLAGVVLLTSTLMAVVVASAAIWAAGGATLNRVVDDERRHRAVSVALAILLAASIGFIWI